MILCKRKFSNSYPVEPFMSNFDIKKSFIMDTIKETLVAFDEKLPHYVVVYTRKYVMKESSFEYDRLPVCASSSQAMLRCFENFKREANTKYIDVEVPEFNVEIKEVPSAEEYKLALCYAEYSVYDGNPTWVNIAERNKWVAPVTWSKDECKRGWEIIAESKGWRKPESEES